MDLPEPGSEFEGKYRIVDILGEGGFARVYEAEDVGAKRRVALKILKPIEGGYQSATESRFHREVKVIGKLRDPHTVTLFDFGRTPDGLLYMVFEFVPGEDLSQVIERQGVLNPGAAVHVLTQVLKSLREAHQHGLLHRDIKPQNIRIYEYMGDPLRVTLLDFGIAKPVEPGPELSAITHAGALVGTPQYMSPEQLLEQELKPASDIYSLGLVAYEMLVGEPAVAGNSLSDQLRILGGQTSLHLPPRANVPMGLRRVIDRMISKEQADRMQSAEQVLRALEASRVADQDISLDETGAVAAYGSTANMRPSTGPQAAPPTTGEQFTQHGPHSSDSVAVRTPAYATSHGAAGSSGTMVRPHPPMAAQHPHYGPTIHDQQPEEEPPVWMFVAAAAALVALVGAAGWMIWALVDTPEEPVVPRLEMAAPLAHVPADSPPEQARLAVEIEPPTPPAVVDGCGVKQDGFGEREVLVTRGVLDDAEPVKVYVPRSYDETRRHPLIVAFHDFGSGPFGIMRRSKLNKIAEKYGVVIMAVEDRWTIDKLTDGIWDSEDDIARVRDGIVHVMEGFCIDRSRVFGYGHGAGGRAIARLACSADEIVATATTSFRPEEQTAEACTTRVVPHLNIDPLKDKGSPTEGGKCGKLTNTVIPLAEYEDRLRRAGECSAVGKVWHRNKYGTCKKWNCEAADRVTCQVKGGREFFGTKPRDDAQANPECDGKPVDFGHAEVIWKFFSEVAPAPDAKSEEPEK